MSFAHQVEGELTVAAAPEAVWAVLADFHQVQRWAREVTRCEPLGEVAEGPGAGRRCDIRGVGTVDEYITEWAPGERLGYSVSRLGPIAASESRWTLEPVPDGTRVQLRLAYAMRFGLAGRLLNTLLARKRLQQSIPRVLRRLQRHLEAA